MKNLLSLALPALIFISCGQNPPETIEAEVATADTSVYTPEWSKDATIYEVNIRQHTPEGTFAAFTEDIARIKNMGIEILWLMPIHPIGEKNRKGTLGSYYSVRDYKGINPEFGTLEDFEALVAEAHKHDMKVIIDWVANHTSFDAVWADSLSWYTLDSVGAMQPTLGTDWWDVADLNFDNQNMRAAMIDALVYWVRDVKIDGYRCDVAGSVPTDFWETAIDSLRAVNKEIFMLAEAEDSEHHDKAFNMSYAWNWLHIMNGIAKGEKTLADIDAYMAKEDTAFSDEAFRMYFITNHDENSWNGTEFDRYGKKGVEAYAVITYTIDGMPLMYGGQESGLDYALEFFEKDSIAWGDYKMTEFYSKLIKLNRDNEALWNGMHGGDFKRLKTTADDQVYAFTRTKGESQVVTIVNLSKKKTKLTFESLPEGDFKSLFDQESLAAIGANGLELAPWGYHVFYR